MTANPSSSKTTDAINFTDYDFAVDRSRFMSTKAHDGSVTIRMPGKNRKTSNHELLFIPYFKKNKLKFKMVAIGKSKTKKTKQAVLVFDQNTLIQESAEIRKYGKTAGFVNSKGHALKMFEILGIPAPKLKNKVVKIYFKLHPMVVNGDKLNYRICTVSVVKVINEGDKHVVPRRYNKRKTDKKAEKVYDSSGHEPSPNKELPENLL